MGSVNLTYIDTDKKNIKDAAKAKIQNQHKLDDERDKVIIIESRNSVFYDEVVEVSKEFPAETIHFSIQLSGDLYIKTYNFEVKNGEVKELCPEASCFPPDWIENELQKINGLSEKEKKELAAEAMEVANRVTLLVLNHAWGEMNYFKITASVEDNIVDLGIAFNSEFPEFVSCEVYRHKNLTDVSCDSTLKHERKTLNGDEEPPFLKLF